VFSVITKRITPLRDLSYQERLAILGLDTLEFRRLSSDLTLYYKIFHNLTPWLPSDYFNLPIPSYNLHSIQHCFNIRSPLYQINIYENSFFNRSVAAWNSLPSSVVNSKSVSSFQSSLKLIDLSVYIKYVF
jgi:hypothetical protein